MRAMVLDVARLAAAAGRARAARAGRGPAAPPRPRLRRLPHRPARRRRRADATEAAARARATRSSARPRTAAGSASRGSAGRAASAASARAAARTSATARASRATTSTAATPSGRVADERFCFPIPDGFGDLEAAPLLCAGLIGYRALRLAGDAERLGLYGFGAAAHIVTQVARAQGRRVFAVTREGRRRGAGVRPLARRGVGGLGPRRPRSSTRRSSSRPAGELVPAALAAVAKGGAVVCAGIHMSDIPSFPYELLWGERIAPLGRQPHAPRRRGVPRARAAGAGADGGRDVPARGGQRGAREAPRGRRPRRARARARWATTVLAGTGSHALSSTLHRAGRVVDVSSGLHGRDGRPRATPHSMRSDARSPAPPRIPGIDPASVDQPMGARDAHPTQGRGPNRPRE